MIAKRLIYSQPMVRNRMNDTVLVEKRDGIAKIIFNRPDVRNAISLDMWQKIARVTEGVGKDEETRAVIFRGAGTEAFASGADISEFKEVRKDAATARAYNKEIEAAFLAVRGCPKPTVAQIFGYCMGGGMALALACDLRFAAEGSRFAIPAARLGIIYGQGSTRQLVDIVGPSRAKDILFSARTFDAREALEMGFINRLLPVEELEAFTEEYIKKVVANAPLSVRGAKVIIESLLDEKSLPFEDGGASKRELIERLYVEALESEDYKEGTRAFLEKRKPRFEGK
ncbi:MAG: enoyl-CoA hydratase [Blastocatellia bacterium]|nr:enoyl-CoA hydratase [Blastocatellia bacterium]